MRSVCVVGADGDDAFEEDRNGADCSVAMLKAEASASLLSALVWPWRGRPSRQSSARKEMDLGCAHDDALSPVDGLALRPMQ